MNLLIKCLGIKIALILVVVLCAFSTHAADVHLGKTFIKDDVANKVITITGIIDHKLYIRMLDLIAIKNSITDETNIIWIFNSPGGNSSAGNRIALLLQSYNSVAWVTTKCYSACAVMFMGAQQRYVAKGAVLGFHAPYHADTKKSFASTSAISIKLSYILHQATPYTQSNWDAVNFIYNKISKTPYNKMYMFKAPHFALFDIKVR